MTHVYRTSGKPRTQAFALIEIAVALFIITIVLAGILVPVTTQVSQRKISDTQRVLDDARDAILGYIVANRRLPCPAAPNTTGVESPAGGGSCTNPYDGFLPATTIGLASTDASGYAIDAWGNRIRYSVTRTAGTFDFTTTDRMKTVGMSTLAPALQVCASSTGITATTCGTSTPLVTNAVAVIYSLGPNGAGGGADESANRNGDQVFISHTQTSSGAANGEFDDMVTWISPYVIYSRMVNAGLLP